MTPDLDCVIEGGSLITGDGSTCLEIASVGLLHGFVEVVLPGKPEPAVSARQTIDATGCLVFPGVINAHAHNCVVGPSMPSGSAPPSQAAVTWQKNRHLLSGTTTLLNVCGLALPQELESSDPHPLDVHLSTAHSSANFRAAQSVDGAGLRERHLRMTIDQALLFGAKALGEVGGGQTLGGGAQEYKYIPEAVKRHTGRDIQPLVARLLRDAVVGRYLQPQDGADDEQLQSVLVSCRLADVLTPASARELIVASVIPSVDLALAGFEEVTRHSQHSGYPAIFHNSTPSVKTLLEVAQKYPRARLIAGHSNHPMFKPEEAVDYARQLKQHGVAIDVSTLDCIVTRWRNDASNFDALVASGVVDTISTDFAGGHWDGILEAIHRIIRKQQMAPAAAIALATGNVARIFPQLAGDRGLIEKGRQADLVIADRTNCARVRDVFIKGKMVVADGVILPMSAGNRR
jgi:predicted amidohydrolase